MTKLILIFILIFTVISFGSENESTKNPITIENALAFFDIDPVNFYSLTAGKKSELLNLKRKMASQKYHPDRDTGDEEKFKLIKINYNFLMNLIVGDDKFKNYTNIDSVVSSIAIVKNQEFKNFLIQTQVPLYEDKNILYPLYVKLILNQNEWIKDIKNIHPQLYELFRRTFVNDLVLTESDFKYLHKFYQQGVYLKFPLFYMVGTIILSSKNNELTPESWEFIKENITNLSISSFMIYRFPHDKMKVPPDFIDLLLQSLTIDETKRESLPTSSAELYKMERQQLFALRFFINKKIYLNEALNFLEKEMIELKDNKYAISYFESIIIDFKLFDYLSKESLEKILESELALYLKGYFTKFFTNDDFFNYLMTYTKNNVDFKLRLFQILENRAEINYENRNTDSTVSQKEFENINKILNTLSAKQNIEYPEKIALKLFSKNYTMYFGGQLKPFKGDSFRYDWAFLCESLDCIKLKIKISLFNRDILFNATDFNQIKTVMNIDPKLLDNIEFVDYYLQNLTILLEVLINTSDPFRVSRNKSPLLPSVKEEFIFLKKKKSLLSLKEKVEKITSPIKYLLNKVNPKTTLQCEKLFN
jgi:hypothetical protein